MESGNFLPQENLGEGCCHAGYYSGIGRYLKDSRTLRYVLVCDECGEEMKVVSSLSYAPSPVFVAV